MADEDISTKRCTECSDTKSLDEFPMRRNRNGERIKNTRCRACIAMHNTAYGKATRKQRNANQREWYAKNQAHARDVNAEWRRNNPEKIKSYREAEPIDKRRARSRETYARNAKAVIAKQKVQRAKDPEKHRAYVRDWFRRNRILASLYMRNRRARLKSSSETHTLSDIAEIYAAQRGKCAYCRKPTGSAFHVDHIIPLKANGSNGRNNLQITCASCNRAKHAKDPIDFAQQIGLLL